MAKTCVACGKSKSFGHKVTFSNKKINRSWAPNIRRVRAVVDGTVKRVNVCSRCLRSGKIERPIHNA
ncbi:MAG: 50S ribosomal protein L28 [Tissierellia bacterium]|jgi:large subunit ribosomal protein L28|nr:50S ribosomal protein L28 [Bacillota bacterium]NLK57854.1 50S ribosomal protein L28 [Tissierellia bacterium]